jgi:glycosyltransferase involved in cell wall biosynthesis
MKDPIRLTIWMNMPSFYQDSVFTALAANEGIDLEVVFARELTADRSDLGWKKNGGSYQRRTLRTRFGGWEAARIARSQIERLHVVNGIWAEPAFAAATSVLARRGVRLAIYAEAPLADDNNSRLMWHRAGRPLKHRFARWLAGKGAALFAVSHFAEDYYRALGFKDDRIYPFGYFRDAPGCYPPIAEGSNRNAVTDIVFVGQLVHRKGLDVLIDAVEPLLDEHRHLKLSVIGRGEDQRSLESLVHSRGLDGRVIFEGVVPSDRIPARIAEADLLVLPSRWDGWGLVVNEALSVGVPVIVSDRCGAVDLIEQGVNGFVFQSEHRSDLRRCLQRFLDHPEKRSSLQASAWRTGQLIGAETASQYLFDCLRHMIGDLKDRPDAPWRSPADSFQSHQVGAR